jgi:uncharacterized surface protein with fasciclin (FAS1) repeats
MRKLSLVVASSAMVAMAAPTVVQAQDKDIVETAAAAGNFKTFTRALTEAGLLETLKGPGPFTVLAPSDDAFAKLPKEKLDALFKDKSALRNVLLYHVIAGKLTAADFAKLNGKGRKTVEGSDARVMVMGETVMIGSANITKADIMAKNGIVHTIDTVLLPPGR